MLIERTRSKCQPTFCLPRRSRHRVLCAARRVLTERRCNEGDVAQEPRQKSSLKVLGKRNVTAAYRADTEYRRVTSLIYKPLVYSRLSAKGIKKEERKKKKRHAHEAWHSGIIGAAVYIPRHRRARMNYNHATRTRDITSSCDTP